MNYIHKGIYMDRRNFLATSIGLTSFNFINNLSANMAEIKSKHKSVILLWMNGGPSTIDLWDMKPESNNGGKFKPIQTEVNGIEICEHLPLIAQNMKHLSIVRSMSTREADHMRGHYYMHTGYVPNPNITHPSYGAVVSHEFQNDLDVPNFVSVGGSSVDAGFLGASYNPFVVDSNGNIRNLNFDMERNRLLDRMTVLDGIENNFIRENRGDLAKNHRKVLNKTLKIMTSKQMEAFKVDKEPKDVQERYGNNSFGKGCLMARRLVQLGVPFIEVDFGGWDMHNGVFTALEQKLPIMDKAMSALVEDLNNKDLYKDTVVIWMGEFGRTPRINPQAGRDHWAKSWSVVVGGGKFNNGMVVGSTNENGTDVETERYSSEDLMASVMNALGVSLNTTFTSNSGRPMKIANSGKLIKELF
jgi:hypothetical protein